MKKLIVLAVTALFAFAVSAQTTAPAAVQADKKESKMETKRTASPKKVAMKADDGKMKRDGMRKNHMKKTEMKKDAIKKDVAPKMEEKK